MCNMKYLVSQRKAVNLENAFELTPQGSVLPISIASSTNAANLATWSVFADGVKQTARFYINASGEACVKAKAGMILFFR